MDANNTIQIADGYTGHTRTFYAAPIAHEGNLVKLRLAEPGKEYMTAWKYRVDWLRALNASATVR